MADGVNVPVYVGPVALMYVQSMVINEGYKIDRIVRSKFSQAIAPTTKTISIEAILIGPDRLKQKKELEALALVSRLLVSTAGPLLAVTGIPVISALTFSLDMQITSLRFTQSVQKREALDVSLSLDYVPRSAASIILSELADVALAAGAPLVISNTAASSTPRTVGGAI